MKSNRLNVKNKYKKISKYLLTILDISISGPHHGISICFKNDFVLCDEYSLFLHSFYLNY